VNWNLGQKYVEHNLLHLVFLDLFILFFVQVDEGNSQHSVKLRVFLVLRRRVHIQFNCDVADVNFDIHYDFLEQFLEEVNRSCFAYFSLYFFFLHVVLLHFVELHHFLFEVLWEFFIGFQSNLNAWYTNLYALGGNIGEGWQGYLKILDDAKVHDVRAAHQVRLVYFLSVYFDILQIQRTVFKVLQAELLLQELV